MRISSITPSFVDIIPDRLENGTLYICERYKTVAHKCCCGCGEEVITPLSPADWSIRLEGKTVSLSPSIGNWSFACKSHYWISKNQILWAGSLSALQIAQVKARDKADKIEYIASVNRQKDQEKKSASLIHKIWEKIRRFLHSSS